MNAALLSSKNMCWCTPQDFYDKLNEEFHFVLDPRNRWIVSNLGLWRCGILQSTVWQNN